MVLIKSISGIRGTLKGKSGENLSPLDIVKYTAAYATLMRTKRSDSNIILIGRDARISGSMIRNLIFGTLVGMGWNVLDLGLSSTPTTAWAVLELKSAGGIVITASHNSQEWNALKFLNKQGELLNISEFEMLLQIVQNKSFSFVSINKFGQIKSDFSIWKRHIQHILNLTGVNPKAISKAKLSVAIDSVNSVGGIIIPPLLQALGVKNIIEIHTTPTGIFKRNPEPLPENLIEISKITKNQKADVGFAVDPDVDRLAIIMENGEPFGEEYTLISIADYVLSYKFGNTVSNISSSRALKNITEQRGYSYSASDVGEVNVVKKMKETSAVIGGEGNGGIIYPESHYGRDALVGIALFLTNLAISRKTVSELKSNYPTYYIIKHSLDLPPDIDINYFFKKIRSNYFTTSPIRTMDGIKFEWADKWMHIRKSNTEPIIRLYAESTIQKEAKKLIQSVISLLSH